MLISIGGFQLYLKPTELWQLRPHSPGEGCPWCIASFPTLSSRPQQHPSSSTSPVGGAPARRPAWQTQLRAAGPPGPSWRRRAGRRRRRAAAPPSPGPSRQTRRGASRGQPHQTSPSRAPARHAHKKAGPAGCPGKNVVGLQGWWGGWGRWSESIQGMARSASGARSWGGHAGQDKGHSLH